MSSEIIASRYAIALYNLDQNLDKHLHDFIKLFEINQFKEIMLSPVVDTKIKKQIIQKILFEVPDVFVNFIKLLIDKNRINIFFMIYNQYKIIKNKKNNIIQIIIYSPQNLDDEQLKSIGEKYKKSFNMNDFETKLIIDKTLLGGICIKIGDIFIDASLKNMLNKTKKDVLFYGMKVTQ